MSNEEEWIHLYVRDPGFWTDSPKRQEPICVHNINDYWLFDRDLRQKRKDYE